MKKFRILHGDNPGSGAERIVESVWKSILPDNVELEIETVWRDDDILAACKRETFDLVFLYFANNIRFFYEGEEVKTSDRPAALLALVKNIREACTSPIWALPFPGWGLASDEIREVADWVRDIPFPIDEFKVEAEKVLKMQL